MKELLKQALDLAVIKLESITPQIKKKKNSISILDVNPIDLAKFMQENNIPNDASFDGRDNGYDAWNDILLSWEVDVSTSEKEKLEYKNRRFHDIAFKYVFDLLTTNGYKRTSGLDIGRITYKKTSNNISSIIMFDNKSVYEMYMDKDLNKLVEYYSMYFVETK